MALAQIQEEGPGVIPILQTKAGGNSPNMWILNPLLFSCYTVPNSLRPHELKHARLPCPSLSSGICGNSGRRAKV